MSAWLVFTALGFYPVTPGSLEYVIGRPFVDRAALTLPNGKHLIVVADRFDAQHPYVGSVSLNGVSVTHAYLRHDQIMARGELRFVMQSMPNKAWAAGAADRPYSSSLSR